MTNAILIGVMAMLILDLLMIILTDMYFKSVSDKCAALEKVYKASMDAFDTLKTAYDQLFESYENLYNFVMDQEAADDKAAKEN